MHAAQWCGMRRGICGMRMDICAIQRNARSHAGLLFSRRLPVGWQMQKRPERLREIAPR